MKRRLAVLVTAGAVALVAAGYARSTMKSPVRLFRRNAELKAQGYYVGEFEFKMLAAQQHLSEGRYLEAFLTLRRIDGEMGDPPQLPRLPMDATPRERAAFLRARQDPDTGAFMDPAYPYFTFFAPTVNAVHALAALSREEGQPPVLDHPLRFLDRLQTRGALRTYLESLLYVDERWAGLPGPGPYGPGVSELAYFDELEQAHLHRFSEEWKDALREWFYDTQDPVTGFWGIRIGDARRWRQRCDVNSTYHVLHLVLDDHGRNRSEKYPLRYAGALARGVLKLVAAPIPDDAVGQHSWGLVQAQGAGILVRLLWPHLSGAEQDEVRAVLRVALKQRAAMFRPTEGGFAYYTEDGSADVDGTAIALEVYRASGALPGTWERQRLWGAALAATPPVVHLRVREWRDAALPAPAGVQSMRVFAHRPPAADAYDDAHLLEIVYPSGSSGVDVMELRQRVAGFLAAHGGALGNWSSKDDLRDVPLDLHRRVEPVPVSYGAPDLSRIAHAHPGVERLYVIGYDLAQVPIFTAEVAMGAAAP